MAKVRGQIGHSNFGISLRVPFICSEIYDDVEITIPDEYEMYETVLGEYMITINGITLPLNTVLGLRQKDNEIILLIPHSLPDDDWSFRVLEWEYINDQYWFIH